MNLAEEAITKKNEDAKITNMSKLSREERSKSSSNNSSLSLSMRKTTLVNVVSPNTVKICDKIEKKK